VESWLNRNSSSLFFLFPFLVLYCTVANSSERKEVVGQETIVLFFLQIYPNREDEHQSRIFNASCARKQQGRKTTKICPREKQQHHARQNFVQQLHRVIEIRCCAEDLGRQHHVRSQNLRCSSSTCREAWLRCSHRST
jgi:hypothetical protein